MQIQRTVTTFGEVAEAMGRLANEWEQVGADALLGALLAGGFTEAVIERTPQSLYRRYKSGQRGDPLKYGQQRLLKSLLRSGRGAPTDWTVKIGRGMVTAVIGSDLDYAVRVHETRHPAEGVYYEASGRGWSKFGTGNRYLEKPWDDNSDRTLTQLMRNLDAWLRRAV